MAWIEFDHVTKRFEEVVAVNDVSFGVEKGEFFTLLGPSGCGKSTTLRLIAGLEIPTEGRVFIASKDVTFIPPGQRNVAMVFQNYALYPHMTVYQNIAYPLTVRKVDRKEIDQRVKYVAENLQIHSLLQRYPMEISGGQQQRVALARAIIQTPNAFLLDEPLSNLDAKLRIEARSFLKHLHMELGTTVVYVTHDQAEAMALSSRIAVMDSGNIRQIGTPKEIYDSPADTFVAGFIGNPPMNLLEVEIIGYRVKLEDQSLEVPELIERLIRPVDGRVTMGIRPEHVKIADRGELKGTVYVVEPLGAEIIITVKLGNQFLKVLTFEEMNISPGDVIGLNLNRDKILLFDERGIRIEKRAK